jgi:hypothetical protein
MVNISKYFALGVSDAGITPYSEVLSMKSTTSQSAEIRKLYDIGVPIAEIARRMDIRYQFAYNIVSKYKRGQVPRGKNNVGGENVRKEGWYPNVLQDELPGCPWHEGIIDIPIITAWPRTLTM